MGWSAPLVILLLFLLSSAAFATEQCSTFAGKTVCRDVRPDGSSPPGYEKRTVNTIDPNMRTGGAGYIPKNSSGLVR